MPEIDLTPDGMIHDRGRGPEIKGTRITVYNIVDHYGKPEPSGSPTFMRYPFHRSVPHSLTSKCT